CGYSPIFSNKESNFSIKELNSEGNKKLNNIISNRLNNYKNLESNNHYSVLINTDLEKKITSKDTKGNPKTFRLNIKSKISVKDLKGNLNEKLFSKSINYNNKQNKFELNKYENEISTNLAEKISEQIIIYLQSM
ncbi:hypothetical protein OAJ09_01490, partial [Candidatus Pelagibacter sp.]|nr:hypothetical protein [Candidatus Pelagibacter sp.]